ncbi:hypothetical protein TUMEXPCC7403_21965 [Tumidithrix helvetica PCC 7403]
MLRVQHLLEHEKYRSAQMQDMFSRFVTLFMNAPNLWDFKFSESFSKV